MLIEHMMQGFSFETFAAVVDVHKETLYDWKKEYPDFSDAYKKGAAKCQYEWEDMGIKACRGQIPNFNVACWIFNMRNRFGWREIPKEETDAHPIRIELIRKPKDAT